VKNQDELSGMEKNLTHHKNIIGRRGTNSLTSVEESQKTSLETGKYQFVFLL